MEEKYIFLILGVILGAAIMLYFFCNREEKIERTIIRNQKVFSTKKARFNNAKCCRAN
ncbi:MAG: hypothetical protein ACLU07_08205 [Lachnospirales bacterium]